MRVVSRRPASVWSRAAGAAVRDALAVAKGVMPAATDDAADAPAANDKGKKGKRKRGPAGADRDGPSGSAAGSAAYLAAELMASETFSPSGLVGTGTLEGAGE